MKALILTEGGKHIGFGHIARCVSLYQELESRNFAPLILVNSDNSSKHLLNKKRFKILNWLAEKQKLLDLMEKRPIVIIDSYLANAEVYQMVSMVAKVPVYIDDNKRLNYPRGIIINGNIYANRLRYKKRSGAIYLLGIKYAFLRGEFCNVPKKKINKKLKSILLIFGGGDSEKLMSRVLNFLAHKHKELFKKVIVNKCFENRNIKRFFRGTKTEFIYSPATPRIIDLMRECDLVITGGGQTLYELAKIGVPAIAICMAKNQLNNVRNWKKTGFIKYAGWHKSSRLLNHIENYLNVFKDYKARRFASERGSRCIDGFGTKRIVDRLLKAVNLRYGLKPKYLEEILGRTAKENIKREHL